jgi:hypothetical protein
MSPLITHKDNECSHFFNSFLGGDQKSLLISTLGFSELCLVFPRVFAHLENVDYLFLNEERPSVAPMLVAAANRNRAVLDALLTGRSVSYETVKIVAEDMKTVAGRRAAAICGLAMQRGYSNIIVDVSAMSRGVYFPVVKQAFERSKFENFGAHVVTAESKATSIRARSMSNDSPQYIHGFHGDMETDDVHSAIKLWIPQLSENAVESLNRIHREVRPHESCPILPFPSIDPRRGDQLLREFKTQVLTDWDVNLIDLIHAHESDPNDVCETICRIHSQRREVLKGATDKPARTILSPSGSRIGSIGMLLAALRHDLPVMYEESVGYTTEQLDVPTLSEHDPDYLWHVWLRP